MSPPYPDFLVIGAQRAGTTWLWTALSRHRDVWMPPVKELHYFDRSPRYPSPSSLAIDSRVKRLFSRSSEASSFRRRLVRRVRRDLRKGKAHERLSALRWDLRYFLGRTDDAWYGSLFAPGADRVRGEITPAYALLEASDVERIAQLIPDIRIVFIIRNPIERAFSQLRYTHGSRMQDGRMSTAEMIRFLDSPVQLMRSDYKRTIEVWSRCFPSDQFYLGFYDRLVEDPVAFLEGLCVFLGLRMPEARERRALRSAVNQSRELSGPRPVLRHLAVTYLRSMRELAEQYGDPATRWVEDARAILEETGKSATA